MILVTGATGQVGGQLAAQAASSGLPVRALVRDSAKGGRLPTGVTPVVGDLSRPDGLAQALDGVESVFLVWPMLPGHAAQDLVKALAAGGVRRVVYLSSQGVAGGTRSPIIDGHREMERLVAGAFAQWTAVRPTGFARNALGWAEQVRSRGEVRAPFATMARPLIHEADIAAVGLLALAGPDLIGQTPVLTGPALVSVAEQVAAIGAALGRPVPLVELTEREALDDFTAQGWDPDLARSILAAWSAMRTAPEPVTDEVRRITGRPALPFAQWARDHAADFGGPAPAATG